MTVRALTIIGQKVGTRPPQVLVWERWLFRQNPSFLSVRSGYGCDMEDGKGGYCRVGRKGLDLDIAFLATTTAMRSMGGEPAASIMKKRIDRETNRKLFCVLGCTNVPSLKSCVHT
jgi:hypothetical protein